MSSTGRGTPARSRRWAVLSSAVTAVMSNTPFPQEAGAEEGSSSGRGFRLWSSGPNFDTELPQDVTGVVGHTAYLTCRVFDRTNSTVSTSSTTYIDR